MIVCVCKAVSDRDVADAISSGACTMAEIATCTRAGTSCGRCHDDIQQALDMHQSPASRPRILLPMLAAVLAESI